MRRLFFHEESIHEVSRRYLKHEYIHTDKLKPICPPLFQSWGHNNIRSFTFFETVSCITEVRGPLAILLSGSSLHAYRKVDKVSFYISLALEPRELFYIYTWKKVKENFKPFLSFKNSNYPVTGDIGFLTAQI